MSEASKHGRRGLLLVVVAVIGLAWAGAPARAAAQSTTTGDIAGVVVDPNNAAVPGATVVMKSTATGAERTLTTTGDGSFRFSLVPPGSYTLTATASGFSPQTVSTPVYVGQVEHAAIKVAPAAQSQTVVVTAEASPLQTENGAIQTQITQEQLTILPNPGNDLTSVVQQSPGVTMNTQSGYGNFSSFGLPAASNLFTVDGMDYNDPFLNLNNSGATNLMLGLNDIEQATVTSNAYEGEFGELGGTDVNYTTRHGGNVWHGNANYSWNGRAMNANDFFNNASGSTGGVANTPRPFDNVNQWSGAFGGPLQKDKTFFWYDLEGINIVLPTSQQVYIPSPGYQAATLSYLANNGESASLPFYKTMFALYNNAPGAGAATVVPSSSCAAANTPADGGILFTGNCQSVFQSTAGNYTHEWQNSVRIDHNLGPNDHVFFRFATDRGVQATYTDPLTPLLNISSIQPQNQGQLSWNHLVGAHAVNSMVLSGLWYSAIFGTDPAARSAVFPATVNFGYTDGEFATLGGLNDDFPQGRKVAQLGLVDDYSDTRGNHTWKFGVNYKITQVNDYDFGGLNAPLIIPDSGSFAQGISDEVLQSFPTVLNQPIRIYTLGFYGEDVWRATSTLQLTLSLRVEHDSNPVCLHDCFADFTAPFAQISHSAATAYDSVISSGLSQAYPSNQSILWQPRLGFAWNPTPRLVVRGGIGLFNDMFPAYVTDSFAENPPLDNTFPVFAAPISPAQPGNGFTSAAAFNAAFQSGFAHGGSLNTISAAAPGFTPPNFFSANGNSTGEILNPQYQEWSLELQQRLGGNSTFDAKYVGNHGIHETFNNGGLNAYATGFPGLPSAPADPEFTNINQLQTYAVSNYNGLVLTYQHQFSRQFQSTLNYTWSHALDMVSNGGLLQYNYDTDVSILGPQDPFNPRLYNYGNSDYDIRQYASGNVVWQAPLQNWVHLGDKRIWQGWQIGETLISRSGLPLTVVDGNGSSTLQEQGCGNCELFANTISANAQPAGCNVKNTTGGVPCIMAAGFSASTSSPTAFGNQIRNQYRGPDYFDTDLNLMKSTPLAFHEGATLALGFSFFNLLNHPNFDEPVNNIASAQFGEITRTVNVPTSLLGAFLGGDSSPRMIQFNLKFSF